MSADLGPGEIDGLEQQKGAGKGSVGQIAVVPIRTVAAQAVVLEADPQSGICGQKTIEFIAHQRLV